MKQMTRAQYEAIRKVRTARDRLARNIERTELCRSDLHELIADAHDTGLSTQRIADEMEYYSQARVTQVVRKCRSR